MAKSSFKAKHAFERRKAECAMMKEKYPDRLPVIIEKLERSNVPCIEQQRFLVPAISTVAHLVYEVRKRTKLSPEKALLIFVNNFLPPTGALMSTVYDEHRDEDGFLYITYSGENTFGHDQRIPPR